jgi:hypothetical protein
MVADKLENLMRQGNITSEGKEPFPAFFKKLCLIA